MTRKGTEHGSPKGYSRLETEAITQKPELGPQRDRKWVPKWARKGTENGSPKGYSNLEPGSWNPETRTRNLNSIVELEVELELKLVRQA